MISTREVHSSDGTRIGYRTSGKGPGLLILHGGMEHSGDYTDLMTSLSERFSTYVPDRRGRGLSGAQGAAHSLQTEIDDVRALLDATGAQLIFGVSSGATIALMAASAIPSIRAIVAYEPALTVPGQKPDTFVDRYDRELSAGDHAAAVVTILKGVGVGPRMLRWMPRPIATFMVRKFLIEDSQEASEDVPLASLIPTQHYDFQIEREASASLAVLDTLAIPVLLLGGSASPRYLSVALTYLQQGHPERQRTTLRGLGHAGSSNDAQGGRPDRVADHVIAFATPRRPDDPTVRSSER